MLRMPLRLVVLTLLLVHPTLGEGFIAGTDPKTGYRIGYYDAKTPDHVPGATLVHTDEVVKLIARGVVLFDVLASKGDGHDPLDGSWPTLPIRQNIAGSVWLPDVGAGTLDKDLLNYFRTNLEKYVGKPPGNPVLFYCRAKCWMSWNASKRAAQLGYTRVFWYPSGTGGWAKANLPLVPAAPPPPVAME